MNAVTPHQKNERENYSSWLVGWSTVRKCDGPCYYFLTQISTLVLNSLFWKIKWELGKQATYARSEKLKILSCISFSAAKYAMVNLGGDVTFRRPSMWTDSANFSFIRSFSSSLMSIYYVAGRQSPYPHGAYILVGERDDKQGFRWL